MMMLSQKHNENVAGDEKKKKQHAKKKEKETGTKPTTLCERRPSQ